MMVNTILFDLDGTLIDTAPDLAYALNQLLQENGLSQKPYEQIKPLVAFGGKALIKFGFECEDSHPQFLKWHQRILEIYTNNIDRSSSTFDGIDALINMLKAQKLHWGIVTNKPENLTHLLLEKLGINPDVIVCGDTLEFNKPHPAPLLYACAQLAIDPRRCLFIGDDKNDMLAGTNANIKTVAVTYGYGKVEKNWNYDYLITHPSELLELI
ncbi:Similar to phosphoglycolate phosphatase, clustered with ubiquinone biosynthesis SAM-dependent O-methyltransferase [uncultured Gammaproteobacteria bacterium]|uniref:HAD family hydrolase n=1 Tax=Bathymodiolus heckerae thiotrophic gill symbiont TaxID=1052212 RepID=UPI0010BB4FED|nr:HAD-IA family hydrolase [Bathymodiolus heckerae thiotrophic gill symbiont]CAC9590375.1 Similar to phosphoglycolate phosphatase, clustered with ubiquinone biosynthesis SAM-dependent O-methyltransferase [uncultured Gammaproteobacteria bacterium]CAC9592632.1 Similar to phosphoglycolate phosphatase, clustered with ubiquinone biosynthesis SAM-dependent O-methyltransferase [uncultured Gammaproteobacteria bacterium]SHN90105.1 Similar to phosphoglycolate phosphatase, clustered with ubiquinone biosynt